jgi:hypothetical protein
MLAHRGLPLRVQIHIGPIIVEQVEIHAHGVRSLHEVEVGVPIVGADVNGDVSHRCRSGTAAHVGSPSRLGDCLSCGDTSKWIVAVP